MKKILVSAAYLFTVCVLFFGCSTTQHQETVTNEIKSEKMVVNTYFDRDDFVILGSVKGESDFVFAADSAPQKFEGDSGKYGYIYEPSQLHVGDKIFIGTGKRSIANSGDEALQRARLNANYNLIEAAYAMGADSILDPVYTVETVADGSQEQGLGMYSGGTVKYKVTVRAKAIQFTAK